MYEQLTDSLLEASPIAVLGVLLVMALLRYGPRWIEVFKQTANVSTANLITGLERRIDQQGETIDRQEALITKLIDRAEAAEAHTRRCLDDNQLLIARMSNMESRLRDLGDISGEHERD